MTPQHAQMDSEASIVANVGFYFHYADRLDRCAVS